MKMMMKMALLVAVLAVPGLASATILGTVEGSADCDGFAAVGQILWGSSPTTDLTWTAVLSNDGGAEVASVGGSAVLTRHTNPYTISGSWGMELCGTYTAVVTAHMHAVSADGLRISDSDASFTATFVCDCPDAHVCNYTPGYWKNHPENWPVMELALGGVNYSQAQLLAIMGTPVRGDATIILAYHLIAAKLNVLGGSDPGIGDAISDADNLLMSYPLGSKPGDPGRSMILDVKDLLADYNELECPDGPTSDSGKSFIDDETPSTWGQLKASYR